VNAPGHFHAAFTAESITKLFEEQGFVDVYAEIRGKLPVWEGEENHPPCLIARGRKPEA
jgi:hypothetical protein